jgi:RNA polymerase sigma factor (sigma-70 family)
MATVERAPDTELLLRLRSRDRTAWEALYGEYQPRLRAFAFRLSGNVHDADDLVQETFVRAVPRLDSLDPSTVDLGAYLFTTCKNLFYKQAEKNKRSEPMADVPEPIAPSAIEDDPERLTLLRNQQRDVRIANGKLESRQRLVLALRELEDRSYAEIGEIVGLKENAVAQLIFRARESLRIEVRLAQIDPERFPEACRVFLPLVAKHLDGELQGKRLHETLAHLEGCARCQSALGDMREASRRYRALFLPPVLDGDECKAAIDLHLDESGFWQRAAAARRLGGLWRISAVAVGAITLAVGGTALGVALASDEPAKHVAAPTTSSTTAPSPVTSSAGVATQPPPPRSPAPTPIVVPVTESELVTTAPEPVEAETTVAVTLAEPTPNPDSESTPKPAQPSPPSPVSPPPATPVDKVAPKLTITSGPTGVTTTDKVEIAFIADEPEAKFVCSTDGSEATACASPVVLTGLAVGAHGFSVLATDKAGNSSPWTVVSWTYTPPDTTAPKVRFAVAPSGTTTSTAATITFTADESPVTFACALDNAPFVACISPASYSKLAAGQHTLSVRATDAAGNVGGPTTTSWTITNPLPDLVIAAFSTSSITVTNRGAATASASVLTITLVGTFTVPSLAPGASTTIRWTSCRAGTYTAIVDRTNVVSESDERNNTASRANTCQVS